MNENTLSSLHLERRSHPEGQSRLSSVTVGRERCCDEVGMIDMEGDGLLFCVRENFNLVSLIVFVERDRRHKQARCAFSLLLLLLLYHRSARVLSYHIIFRSIIVLVHPLTLSPLV